MFIFLLILALILVSSMQAGPSETTDLDNENLKGQVHIVHQQSSESMVIDGHESKARDRKLDTLTFNRNGRLLERIIYDDYGFLVGKEKYSLDRNGHLTLTELFDPKGRRQKRVFAYRESRLSEILTYDEKGVAGLKQVYVYNDKGNLVEESYYAGTRPVGKTSFGIDANGNAAEAAFFLADGSKAVAPIGPCFRVHRVVYDYDGLRRVTQQTAYQTDGSLKRKSTYRYDGKNHIIEELRVDAFSTLKYVYDYEYDAQGNWIKQVIRVHTSRVPLYGNQRDESERTIIKTRIITYYR